MGLAFAIFVTILIEIVLPIAMAFWAIKYLKVKWLTILIGMMIFVVVQVIQLPLLSWLSNLINSIGAENINSSWRPVIDGIIIGLTAGLLTELARWGSFNFIKQLVNDNFHAITLGIGYALIETILLAGIPILVSFITMFIYKNADINDPTLPEGLAAQVKMLWQTSWHIPLIGAVERLVSIITHITLSVIVFQTFITSKIRFLFYAIVWHTFIDAIPVIMSEFNIDTWLIDLFFLFYCLMNLIILNRLGIIKILRKQLIIKEEVTRKGVGYD